MFHWVHGSELIAALPVQLLYFEDKQSVGMGRSAAKGTIEYVPPHSARPRFA
jgi:hypothetical protein